MWNHTLFFLCIIYCTTEKAMAPYSSALAWEIPWTEEPGRLQSMGSLRVRHDWATSFSLFTFMHWRRKWQPTPVFLPGESQRRGSLVGCCLWVTQGRTQLKWLSSRAKLLNHQGDPFCSSAGNELRKLGSHLADRIILFDKQLKSICKQEQIGICHFHPRPRHRPTNWAYDQDCLGFRGFFCL